LHDSSGKKQECFLIGLSRAGKETKLLLTIFALLAFASNSLLCRQTLGSGGMDAATFTTIRLAAGAIALWAIRQLGTKRPATQKLDRLGALWLFVYAAAFSFAYLSLSAGTGALILFAAVQFTMLISGRRAGEQLSAASWLGIALSLGGLIYLVLPGLAAPSLPAAGLMALAGTAWGLYSLRNRGMTDALSRTAGNFLGAAILSLGLSIIFARATHVSAAGIARAIISGAVTSGMGYVLWYAALPRMTSTVAASVQLAVPILAALGGILLLGEHFSVRLLIAALAILSGIALVLRSRAARVTPSPAAVTS
jgi:drug/metabolite transporter (DMT)-like permease